MKKVLMISILMVIGSTISFAQASKNIHQLFTMKESIEKLNINVPSSNIQIKKVKSSRIRVEITVKLETPNLNMLEFLIDKGRYELVQETNNLETELSISSKKNNNVIIIKGKECKEELSYIVYIPESIEQVSAMSLETGERAVVAIDN
ncbi:MAG: hypothetical protein GY810_03675 [Aureispira sp.]|nr:hypothetical protein [Aureispira sp.]